MKGLHKAVLVVLCSIVVAASLGCVPPEDSPEGIANSKRQESYALKRANRPTHWSQKQWDLLDRYLKKIDALEQRLDAFENSETHKKPTSCVCRQNTKGDSWIK